MIIYSLIYVIFGGIAYVSGSYGIRPKIIGGTPVSSNKFSYAVLFFNMDSVCSGTILNSYSVLTAAHCFESNTNIYEMFIQRSRYIRQVNAEIFSVLSFVLHKDYNSVAPFHTDIALVFVKDPMKFEGKNKKALLVNNNKWMKSSNKAITAVGWGWTKSGGPLSKQGLLRTTLQYVRRRKCEKSLGVNLTTDMFCLYGNGSRDTCKGDSGGGVIWNDTIIGIVSHGDGCAKKNKPSVYINVLFYLTWIKQQVLNFSKNYCKMVKAE